jgi:hypothetical protein
MQVAAGGTSHDVFIWNIDINKRTCKMIHRLKAHESVIVAVAYYNFQGVSCVISASPDDMVRLWDVNTGVTIRMFSYGTFIPTSMAVQGDTLAVACWDNSLHLWAIGDTSTARPSRTIKGNERTIKAIAIDPSNVHVAVATGFLIKIWEISTGELYQELRGHRTLVTSLAFGLVRGTMALTTTSMDGEVRIWAYQPLHDPRSPNRGHTKDGKLGIIMVFYPQPIMEIALKDKGLPVELPDTLKSDRRVWMERLEKVTFLDLKKTAMEHIRSFIDIPIPQFGNVILEIVHSGIGLGYNESVGSCTNPKNGHAIKSAEVIFISRLDRAMIEVSLDLKKRYPHMVFSSCTRLSDVYLSGPDAEYTRDLMRGNLKPQITGDEGVAARLRTIHGGMYPQSDIVVADDPIAEIAARTWIDEFAGLDRSQLLTMTYDRWLAQNPLVKEVIDELNGKFWPNTVGRVSDTVGLSVIPAERAKNVALEQYFGPTLVLPLRVQERPDRSQPELINSNAQQSREVSKRSWRLRRS